ncbi:hypothetical protein JOC54_003238 [Alkalihalobacillus xiaoxiensis]|uniref:Uncharacterized protein n=1 Tax=Shouchella xiaoxiensis TaxID=766895 RepID=A0ABS2SWN8_9BACI|nr:hypothetical protein [Shouchella xiaoxiensis]MBM7839958.1 hypothetical protein [Shouchella xiaoxiensis]
MNFKRFGLGIVTFVVGVILMVSGSSSEPTPQQAMNSDDTASAEAEDEKRLMK